MIIQYIDRYVWQSFLSNNNFIHDTDNVHKTVLKKILFYTKGFLTCFISTPQQFSLVFFFFQFEITSTVMIIFQ